MTEINYSKFEKTTDFLKMTEGDNFIRLLTPAYRGYFHEMNMATGFKSIECKGPGCDMCAKSKYSPILKYTWIAMNRVTKKIGILKLSKGLAEKICDEIKKHPEYLDRDIQINRIGTKKEDTKYQFEFLKVEKPLSVEEQEIVSTQKPILIKKYIL